MLELRPNCELCDRDLPPDPAEARICSYGCTFCARHTPYAQCQIEAFSRTLRDLPPQGR